MKDSIVKVKDYGNYKIMCTLGPRSDIIRRLDIYLQDKPCAKSSRWRVMKEAGGGKRVEMRVRSE